MAILRTNLKCGHAQRICPRCLSVGCGNSTCENCIGNNSRLVCKVCGSNEVMSMETYQSQKKAHAKAQERRIDDAIERIEKVSTTPIQYTNTNIGSGGSTTSWFSLRNIIILFICYGLSHFFHYKDYDGLLYVLVGTINVLGGIPDLIFMIATKLLA